MIVAASVSATAPAAAAPAESSLARETELQRRIKAAIDGHILPRLERLVRSTHRLDNAVSTYCASGEATSWHQVQTTFAGAVTSWALISHLNFGPVTEKARALRLSFWPDPRGIVWRQLRSVLAKQDTKFLDARLLADQSVALQGLPALQILLQRPVIEASKSNDKPKFKCSLATAIAGNTHMTARAMLDGWQGENGYRSRMLAPQVTISGETTYKVAFKDLVKSVLFGFQIIRERQVLILQEVAAGKSRMSLLPYFQAGLWKTYLRAMIEGTCELMSTLQLSSYAPKDKAWTGPWLGKACEVMKQRAANLPLTATKENFRDKVEAFDLRQLRFYSNGMRQIIGRQIAPEAGLTLGFNELDGD